jgi:hypothetical protein
MPKLNARKPQCEVSWCAEDIQERCPDWSVERCQEFLDDAEDHIQGAMIEAGWDAIDKCLRWED